MNDPSARDSQQPGHPGGDGSSARPASPDVARGDVVLSARGLHKSFRETGETLHILRGADIDIRAGEVLAIVGVSGSGKSTLLHILGTLDRPDQGEIHLDGQDLLRLSDAEISSIRSRRLGFVFQFHHLLPEFTAEENIAMPLYIGGMARKQANERARALLEDVGLGPRRGHRPAELSGGERQRVALARALSNRPGVVFADEPTGNLDPATAMRLFELVFGLSEKYSQAFVLVTHDSRIADGAHRRLRLEEGVAIPC